MLPMGSPKPRRTQPRFLRRCQLAHAEERRTIKCPRRNRNGQAPPPAACCSQRDRSMPAVKRGLPGGPRKGSGQPARGFRPAQEDVSQPTASLFGERPGEQQSLDLARSLAQHVSPPAMTTSTVEAPAAATALTGSSRTPVGGGPWRRGSRPAWGTGAKLCLAPTAISWCRAVLITTRPSSSG
jgi:hypothetical protein